MAASPESRLLAAINAATSTAVGGGHGLHSAQANEWTEEVARLAHAQSVVISFLDGSSTVSAQHLTNTVQALSTHAQSCLGEQAWIPISRRYERELHDALSLPSTSSSSNKVHAGRAEDILRKASSVYARYEQVVHLLHQHRLTESLRLISQRALLLYKSDFAHAVYQDLRTARHQSLVRDALLALGLESLWRELVAHASHRLLESKVLYRTSDNDLGLDDEHSSDDDDDSNDGTADERQHDFETTALPALHDWIHSAIESLLNAWQVAHSEHLLQQLLYTLHKTLGQLRARQLFDIISDFPQSSPALQDLIACSEQQTDIKVYVSAQLSDALQARLLHPGASTRDIIQYYTHLMRALRYVDPSGVILSHVIGPVRSYLRARADTIPVIVASLLGQAGDFTLLRDMMREAADMSGLGRKNGNTNAAVADTSLTIYDDTTTTAGADGLTVDIAAMDESKRMVFIPEADEDWAPRPIDAGPDYRQSRKSDVIAIIVSIFDDEEGFIAALERSCAEQIVQVSQYDMHKEYETNENLKKRFGDASMSRCDVMLNDVKRSQRTDRSIHRAIEQGNAMIDDGNDEEGDDRNGVVAALAVLHPLILSRQFWPLFKEDDPSPGARASAHSGAAANGTDGASMMFASAPLGNSSNTGGGSGAAHPAEEAQPLPRAYVRALSAYQRHFGTIVHGRKLRWLPGRDQVRVHVEMHDGRTLDERVTPIQAAVLQLAADASKSPANTSSSSSSSSHGTGEDSVLLLTDAVAEQLGVASDAAHKAMLFWTARGLLAEVSRGSFTIVEGASR